MYNENEGSISCIAVGDMLKKRLQEYTDTLASGADETTVARMEDEIDRIEAVHDKCVEMGNVTNVDTPSNVADESEGEGEGDVEEVIADEVFDGDDGY